MDKPRNQKNINWREEIKAMRKSKRGYGSIAKLLGMSKLTIQRFCIRGRLILMEFERKNK